MPSSALTKNNSSHSAGWWGGQEGSGLQDSFPVANSEFQQRSLSRKIFSFLPQRFLTLLWVCKLNAYTVGGKKKRLGRIHEEKTLLRDKKGTHHQTPTQAATKLLPLQAPLSHSPGCTNCDCESKAWITKSEVQVKGSLVYLFALSLSTVLKFCMLDVLSTSYNTRMHALTLKGALEETQLCWLPC